MKNKEMIKKLGAEIDKEFEKIKRKALKIAPIFASALPGGATLATGLYAYNQHLAALNFGKEALGHAAEAQMLETFAHRALDYIRAVAIGDEKEIERTAGAYEQMFSVDNEENINMIERYLGEDGQDFILNLVGSTQRNALDDTAEKFGFESGLDLAYEMSKNPELEDKVRADYMNNLYEHAEVARTDLTTDGSPIYEHNMAYSEAVDNMAQATEQVSYGTGIGVALAAATMAVTMVVVHKQQKLAQKLDAEAKAEEKNAQKEEDLSM